MTDWILSELMINDVESRRTSPRIVNDGSPRRNIIYDQVYHCNIDELQTSTTILWISFLSLFFSYIYPMTSPSGSVASKFCIRQESCITHSSLFWTSQDLDRHALFVGQRAHDPDYLSPVQLYRWFWRSSFNWRTVSTSTSYMHVRAWCVSVFILVLIHSSYRAFLSRYAIESTRWILPEYVQSWWSDPICWNAARWCIFIRTCTVRNDADVAVSVSSREEEDDAESLFNTWTLKRTEWQRHVGWQTTRWSPDGVLLMIYSLS